MAAFTLKKPVSVQADPLFDVADRLTQEFVRVRAVSTANHGFFYLLRLSVLLSATLLERYVLHVRHNPSVSFFQSREGDREAMILSLCTRNFKRGTIVFFDKKQDAHRMFIIMSLLGMNCGELHGNLSQQQRLQAYDDFDSGTQLFLISNCGVPSVDIPLPCREGVHSVGH